MINYSLIILAFIGGYFFHKKKDNLIAFIKSIKFFLQMSRKDDQVYNEFFEDYFNKEDYVKERDDNKNV